MTLPKPAKPQKSNSSASGMLREELLFVGWTDNDPIPPNLLEVLQRLKQEAISDLEESLAEKPDKDVRKQLDDILRSKFAKITNLPPKQQMEAREYVEACIDAARLQAANASKRAEIDAKIPAAIQGEEREKIHAMAERRLMAESAPQSPPPAAEPQGSYIVDDRNTAAPLPPETKHCPCCHWDTSKPYQFEITKEDKERFVAALLGGKRFERTYTIFGGTVEIVYQSLTTAEINMLREELMFRSRHSEIVSDSGYLAAWVEGRLMMGIKEISRNGAPIVLLRDIHTWAAANPPAPTSKEITPIKRYTEYFYSQVTQDYMRKLLMEKHKLFEQLEETLLARVDDPNFY